MGGLAGILLVDIGVVVASTVHNELSITLICHTFVARMQTFPTTDSTSENHTACKK